MTFNKISRLPVIGDLAGVYFVYNTDTPIINGIYVKSTNESAAIKMADVAETLNGSNYVMVYGTGTPTENAAELQATYNEAKKMPRHLGTFNSGSFINIYKGQTFVNSSIPIKFFIAKTDFAGTIGAAPVGTFAGSDLQSEFDAALARRVNVIVAPGEYDFGATAFVVDTPYINIVSLTGNSDVIISSTEKNFEYKYIYGIKVTANNVLVKGINCKTNTFYIGNYLDNLICEYCIGGKFSFGAFGTASGTFTNCIGGEYSFAFFGTASGIFTNCTGNDSSFGSNSSGNASGRFTNCTGGNNSFGGYGGTASGIFTNCIAGERSFGTGTASGTFNNCIGGDVSFGSDGTASGTFNYCIGGNNSFGGNSGTINATARLYYTRLTSGTFKTPEAGGRLILCIDGNNDIKTV